jgi:hypothetical protein
MGTYVFFCGACGKLVDRPGLVGYLGGGVNRAGFAPWT